MSHSKIKLVVIVLISISLSTLAIFLYFYLSTINNTTYINIDNDNTTEIIEHRRIGMTPEVEERFLKEIFNIKEEKIGTKILRLEAPAPTCRTGYVSIY